MSGSIEQPPPLPPPQSPSLSDHSFQNSNSRSVYSGSNSHRFMDPDVIEIPPPPPSTHNSSNLLKQKQPIFPDVIDIDNDDDDSTDLVVVGEKVVNSNKGKTIESVHNGYGDHQTMEDFDNIYYPPVIDKSGPSSRVESSNGYTSASKNLISIDDQGSDQSYDDDDDDDDLSDLFMDDYMDVDNYTLLQEHFDNANIPPGIEAPVPWLKEYDLGSKKPESSLFHPSFHIPQSDSKNSQGSGLFQPTWSLEPIKPETQEPSAGSTSVQSKVESIDHPSKIQLPPPLFSQSVPSMKKFDAGQSRRRKLKLPVGMESSTSNLFSGPSGFKKPYVFGSSTNFSSLGNSEAMKLPHVGESPHWKLLEMAKKAGGTGSISSHQSNFLGPVNGSFPFSGTEFVNPWLNSSHFNPYPNHTANSGFFNPFVPLHATPEQMFNNPWVHNPARDGNNGPTADSTVVAISDEARDEILKKFQNFKQFDTIDDTSDHYYVHKNSSTELHSKNWVKRIQEEWKSLEKDLPDSIFVRVYESRIDLLRAVIIGAEGTPYHDGLFFFDFFFPSGFPNVPPHVYYHSGGLRLNPNLYNCGKVCLSLLNTWSGNKNEKWLPGVSTILQVLVSIQGLILNTMPYFNEPGYARLSGSAEGEMRSLRYNEDTFLLSLRTMVYLIRRPPKSFEDFVKGHFCSRAQDILVACKAYIDGAQVGCLVKGGVQDVDQGDKSCSKEFKHSLPAYVDMLVKEFTQVGARDCEKFLSSSTVSNKPLE